MVADLDKIVTDIYTHGVSITSDFIDQEIVKQLLCFFNEKRTELKQAGVGNRRTALKHAEIRNDRTVWVEEDDDESLRRYFFDPIHELILRLNRRCFLGLKDHEFHFALYEKGSFYKKHKDSFSNDDARKVSVVLYLNLNWKEGDGGELMIYTEEGIKVKPLAGTLVVFESHIEHEVLPSNTERISLTGWLKNKALL